MEDYIQALRSKDETPGSLLAMTEDAESAILDKYRIEIERKVNEKEHQRLAEKQRKEQRSQEREKIREEKMRLQAKNAEKAFRAQQQKEQEQEVKTEAAQQSSKEQTSESVVEVKETTVEYTEESVYLWVQVDKWVATWLRVVRKSSDRAETSGLLSGLSGNWAFSSRNWLTAGVRHFNQLEI